MHLRYISHLSVIKSMGKEHKSISVSENKLSGLQELVYHYLQCILERTVFVTHSFMFCIFLKRDIVSLRMSHIIQEQVLSWYFMKGNFNTSGHFRILCGLCLI